MSEATDMHQEGGGDLNGEKKVSNQDEERAHVN